MKKLTMIAVLVLPLVANAQTYNSAWGQPLPANCSWQYVNNVPTYNGAQCIKPFFTNMVQFWNWFTTRPEPTK